MSGESHLSTTLAVLLGAGGIAGYMKKGSVPSLVAGVALGSGYLASAYLLRNGSEEQGHWVGFASSQALFLGMAPRVAARKGSMPIALCSLGMLGSFYFGNRAVQWGDTQVIQEKEDK
mmetsp:Transcript_15335/g.24984  ORF Transcript_15335/g.24984 Transcript_15335/m.24984 type:complete len:118 (+) Transcript_15335:345-698(+)|eukprot:CAMPEP_0203786232 /NCGR_PEP_ID=MMETSP0100_2-20121128/1503_1 /ASSEMBLY_ACC=CAM_ASM_000210 /TAXON_ID=96639 /ORGANISM=" , Strain NY0313808BC1" /LENGTH=117 /DNA_ID=CAMNT_0050688493 /DNA_START=262 /DNA_END=615 /DNA_ORIENTATION=-